MSIRAPLTDPCPTWASALILQEVPVTEPRTTGKSDAAAEAVAAAIGRLTGEGAGASPADIATEAGVPYSTTNKKLRALKAAGRAESFDSPDKRTVWRLTGASHPSAASHAEEAPEPDSATVPDRATAPDPAAAPTLDGDPAAATTHTAVEEPADDGTADTDAAPTPAEATEPDPETADQPGGAAHDAPTDPPGATATTDPAGTRGNTDAVGDAEAGDAEAGDAAPPATRPAARTRRTRSRTAAGDSDGAPGTSRRAGGTLRGAILDILEANPDQQYKVAALCKAIDAANAGTGKAKASQGAVYNAVVKLVADQRAVQTVDKPATFQLAPPTAG